MSNAVNYICKRCGCPLPSARLKSPTQGWYCPPCYRVVFIIPQPSLAVAGPVPTRASFNKGVA